MEITPFTLRMEEALHDELKLVSRLAGTSMTQLAVRGIRMELDFLRAKYERDLKRTLKRLEGYSKRDPNSSDAIRAFARAEIENEDPLEGRPFRSDPHSEAQRDFRELLDGS